MNPIDATFTRLRGEKRLAFMPFLTAGDPDLDFTARLIRTCADAGADLIEVGFPFSDPIADGPVIQASYTRALERGTRVHDVLKTISTVTKSPGWTTPVVGMVSYTLIYRMGEEAFLQQAQQAGLSGLIVPDLPIEEGDKLAEAATRCDLKLILLVTPTTAPDRAREIVRRCGGFVYCVSVVGITGERDTLPPALEEQLRQLRELTELPLCVGFGISKPEQAHTLHGVADGVIVGSALVRRVERIATEGADPEEILNEVSQFVRDFTA